MSNDDDMSDEELDSLIDDLDAGEASGDVAAGDGVPEEEIDDFLAELEGEESGNGGSPKTEQAVADPEPEVDADLSGLEGMDDLPVQSDDGGTPDKAEQTKAPADTETEESGEASESTSSESGFSWKRAGEYAWITAKWSAYVVPTLVFWWLLGAYLRQWVTAGWLTFLMTTGATFGLPKLGYDLSGKRGRYRWWLAGMALLLTVALTAPLLGTAGTVLAEYGGWPGLAVEEVFGSQFGIGGLFGALGELIGGQLTP